MKRQGTAVEWGLVAALIAVGAIALMQLVGPPADDECPMVQPDQNGVVAIPPGGCVRIPDRPAAHQASTR